MRILVPLDGSEYGRKAVSFLASRSTLIGAEPELHLLNVQPALPGQAAAQLGRQTVRRIYESEAETVLAPARKALAKAGLAVETHADSGHPALRIAQIADDLKADLIVLGAHGYSEFKGLLFGSVTHGVLARSRKPVLVLRGARAPRGDGLRTGIAVDGSKYGLAAVKFALRHRGLFGAGAKLTLLHVVPDFVMPVMADLGGVAMPSFTEQEIRILQDKDFEKAVAPARRLLEKAKVTADEVRLSGMPGEQIAAYAKKHLDVLLVGSHGYGGFKTAVLGSVATRIAARCDTPLLIVRA
ncbi:MAG: universal stress protein [Burkholderiaceae bacterium]|nr:universal stress protein [Burkholderiaceae bacterium]